MSMDYALLDCGDGEKLERFGELILIRPAAAAIWSKTLPPKEWMKAHARFSRDRGNRWEHYHSTPEMWDVCHEGLKFHLKRTDFGHLGLFPEHASFWPIMQTNIHKAQRKIKVLNLFAYSGGATLACAKAGAEVCHLDASKGMIDWARDNARLNNLEEFPIRWIVDDAKKYLKRAVRRQESYDAIILDPPSFGRGKSKEVFKIEKDLIAILQECKNLLSERPLFFLLTCHTPGFTPLVLQQLLAEVLNKPVRSGEMVLKGSKALAAGSFAEWGLG